MLMEKQESLWGRDFPNFRKFLPVAFAACLVFSAPVKGYGETMPAPDRVQQQTLKVSGVVKDAKGEPIIGANVIAVGTAIGAITNLDGGFTLNVPAGTKFYWL